MRWATRRHVHVDRAACAWLIRRFIDPEATFVFVGDPADLPADATAYDIRGARLGHHEGRCSFESIILEFDLAADPALEALAQIVHEADLSDDAFDAPSARGLDVVIRGLSMTSDSDEATLAVTDRLFDGLYAYERQRLLTGRTPAEGGEN